MKKRVIELFREITKIPHCSGKTEKLKDFIINFSKNYAEVNVDKSGNILLKKGEPKICFQAHYDMVCVGNSEIEIIEKDGWLMAKDSSLGADNGIGVAIILALIQKYNNIEALLTNDEEIGLVGAFNLDLQIDSKYLLNLDSEDENIYIGCAGGVDAKINYPIKKIKKKGFLADISITNLPGGHSGVDIDKNIPNAIKEIIKNLNEVAELRGGERRNSIASNARAKIFFENVNAKEVEVFSRDYIEFLDKLPHGVMEFDFEFGVVSKSINLAIVNNEEIILSLRANSNEKLQELKEYLLSFGDFKFEGEYPAWKPEINELARILKELLNKDYKVIHAGLECAVLKNKFSDVKMASIGPIIENPHSIRERVNLKSVEKIVEVIIKLLERIENGEIN